MTPREIKRKLRDGQPTLGSWLTFRDPAVAEILARAGFDWLGIDMEHSPITISEAQELIRAISLCGVTALVRLSSNDQTLAKRVLDAGAGGIIVPMVNNAEDAKQAVAMAKYPPAGTRSAGLARAQSYGPGFEDYIAHANDDTIVVVQIEHTDGVKNAAKILAVDGIDAYMVGPYDLTASMGIPGRFHEKSYTAALEKVRAAGKSAGVPAGLHVVYPDPAELKKRAGEGYLFLVHSVDFLMLGESARAGVKTFKGQA
jgi:2-keto-3-deoxy-L-rhamnonate aldolase RhmA